MTAPHDPVATFAMTPPGPFEAGTHATLTFRITVGTRGVRRGGWIKIATPNMGWGRPLCVETWQGHEFLVGTEREHNPWKPLNTTHRLETKGKAVIHLRAEERGLVAKHATDEMNLIALKYPTWKWWITATVEGDDLAAGDELEIVYGNTEAHGLGAQVPQWSEEPHQGFVAIAAPEGGKVFEELAGSPVIVAVTPGPPERVVAVLPSVARPGDELPVRLNVLDRNLGVPSEPYEGDVEISGMGVADMVEREDELVVRVEEEGLGRIEVCGPERRKSNPVMVLPDQEMNLYWGDLHAQSKYHLEFKEAGHGASCGAPKELHAYARDCSMLDFTAITDSGAPHTDRHGWAEIQQAVVDCYEPGRYVTFKGWEHGMGVQGDRCMVYRSAEVEPPFDLPPPSKELATNAHVLLDFYRRHPERVLTIGHSFMKYLDWTVTDPELDRVMEIYSTWGSYESRTDNPLNSKRQPKNQSAQHAWRTGLLLGITAAGDSHIGHPGRSISYGDRLWCQCFKSGICGVYAPELTREAVWDGLYNRSCYGTTGVRIVLDFKLNDAPMGSVLERGDEELLTRRITVRVAGTDWIRRVDVLKNNVLAHREEPNDDCADFVLEETLDEPPTTRDWYYVRVFQADGNAAWSSPIWIGPQGVTTPTPSDIE